MHRADLQREVLDSTACSRERILLSLSIFAVIQVAIATAALWGVTWLADALDRNSPAATLETADHQAWVFRFTIGCLVVVPLHWVALLSRCNLLSFPEKTATDWYDRICPVPRPSVETRVHSLATYLTVYLGVVSYILLNSFGFAFTGNTLRKYKLASDGIRGQDAAVHMNCTALHEAAQAVTPEASYFVLDGGGWFVAWDNASSTRNEDGDHLYTARIHHTGGECQALADVRAVCRAGRPEPSVACPGATPQSDVTIRRLSASDEIDRDRGNFTEDHPEDMLFEFDTATLEEVQGWVSDVEARRNLMQAVMFSLWAVLALTAAGASVGLLLYNGANVFAEVVVLPSLGTGPDNSV